MDYSKTFSSKGVFCQLSIFCIYHFRSSYWQGTDCNMAWTEICYTSLPTNNSFQGYTCVILPSTWCEGSMGFRCYNTFTYYYGNHSTSSILHAAISDSCKSGETRYSIYFQSLVARCREKKSAVFSISTVFVMLCAIWYHLHNLKNMENTDGGVLP